jgi:hypothetical protein
MRQRPFMVEHLAQVATIYPTAGRLALIKMLGSVFDWRTDAPTDVLPARNVDHFCASSCLTRAARCGGMGAASASY